MTNLQQEGETKMNWIKWKIYWLKCELIYLLGGTPNEHIGTLHYRNINSVVADIKEKIERANQ